MKEYNKDKEPSYVIQMQMSQKLTANSFKWKKVHLI